MNKNKLLLYAITDRRGASLKSFLEDIEKALSGGVTMLQLREKCISEGEFIFLAAEVKKICSQYDVPLIINDNVSVCAAAGADGVHLGQSDTDPAEARRILGDNAIIGVTARTVEQAATAQAKGADYIGSGAVFGTMTKKDAVKMTIETLKKICSAINIPVVAIGGITADNVCRLNETGISGAAVVSGIFSRTDIAAAAEELRSKLLFCQSDKDRL